MSNILCLANPRFVSSQASRVVSCFPLIQEKCMKLHHQLMQVYKIRKSREVYEKNVARTFSCTPTLTAARRRTANRNKNAEPLRFSPKPMKMDNVVTVTTNMTVEKLAEAVNRTPDDIFEVLLYVDGGDRYEEETSVIGDFNVIKDVVKKLGMRYMMQETSPKKEVRKEKFDVPRQPPPDPSVLVKRPPVVTIMGHVDHGKTTLLDYLRKSKIVDKEFGGITQHIGAFSVQLPSGETISFLDTPGHAAFSAMRARGAQVTDIVILVVAGDDGVMQQTVESIQHAKEANVPIIVAVNKMDKPEADLERTKRMLMQHQLVIEEYGGDVQVVPISALKGTNISALQETIVTLAEMLEIKADPVGLVEGHVVESKTDPGRGKLVTAIVQRGTLTKGAIIVSGNTWAKVRGMFNESGKPIQSAPPSTPVEIIGWRDLPSAGDEILEATSEKIAKEAVDFRLEQLLENKSMEDQDVIKEKRAEHQKIYLEEVERKRQLGYRRKIRKKREKETIITHEGPQLSLVLKGDVDGSLEAILDTLATYRSKKCRLDIIHYGVGNITEQDVKMAETFDGIVMGFNVIAPSAIRNIAKSCEVPVSIHQVIYKLFDDLHSKLSEKLPLLQETDMIGEAKVLKVFHISSGKNKIPVAGCRCTKGLINKKKNIKVLRKDNVIYDGPMESLKHMKKEVDSIKLDVECGISVEDRSVEFKEGDVIECYEVREVKQVIDWDPGF